jgi:hypothetical protein
VAHLPSLGEGQNEPRAYSVGVRARVCGHKVCAVVRWAGTYAPTNCACGPPGKPSRACTAPTLAQRASGADWEQLNHGLFTTSASFSSTAELSAWWGRPAACSSAARACRWAHRLPREEVITRSRAVPRDDPCRIHRPPLRPGAAAALPRGEPAAVVGFVLAAHCAGAAGVVGRDGRRPGASGRRARALGASSALPRPMRAARNALGQPWATHDG